MHSSKIIAGLMIMGLIFVALAGLIYTNDSISGSREFENMDNTAQQNIEETQEKTGWTVDIGVWVAIIGLGVAGIALIYAMIKAFAKFM